MYIQRFFCVFVRSSRTHSVSEFKLIQSQITVNLELNLSRFRVKSQLIQSQITVDLELNQSQNTVDSESNLSRFRVKSHLIQSLSLESSFVRDCLTQTCLLTRI